MRHTVIAIAACTLLVTGCGAPGDDASNGITPGDSVLLTSSNSSWSPQIVVAPNGNAIAVWTEESALPERYIYAKYYTVGSGWGDRVSLLHMTNHTEFFDLGYGYEIGERDVNIGIDGQGNAIATWSVWDGTRNNIYARRYAIGSGWENTATLISSGLSYAYAEKIAVATNGNAVVVWSQNDGLWANSFTIADGWGTTPQQINTIGDNDDAPQLAIDSDGNAMAMWHNNDGLQAKHYGVNSGWDVNATVIQSEDGAVVSAHIGFDGSGNVIAMWFQDGDASSVYRWEIIVNRYTVSNNTWGTAQRYDLMNGGTTSDTSYVPVVTFGVDIQGNALVVWGNLDSQILQTNRYASTTGWGTTTTLVNYVTNFDVAVDATGRGVAAWLINKSNTSTSDYTIATKQFAPAVGWGSATEHKTEFTVYDGISPYVASNASGQFFVVWEEVHNIATYRVP